MTVIVLHSGESTWGSNPWSFTGGKGNLDVLICWGIKYWTQIQSVHLKENLNLDFTVPLFSTTLKCKILLGWEPWATSANLDDGAAVVLMQVDALVTLQIQEEARCQQNDEIYIWFKRLYVGVASVLQLPLTASRQLTMEQWDLGNLINVRSSGSSDSTQKWQLPVARWSFAWTTRPAKDFFPSKVTRDKPRMMD